MKLTIFNGSPRGKNSNSAVLTKWIAQGAAEAERAAGETGETERVTGEIGDKERSAGETSGTVRVEYEELFLVKTQEHKSYAKKFEESDISLLVFPLYTDSMPGIVAAFIEELASLAGKMQGKKLGFVVHSGFPEACHSRYVEKYLVRLTGILGADYAGTAVMGSSEPTRMIPESKQQKKGELFARLGRSIVREGSFDKATLYELAPLEKLTGLTLLIYKMGSATGLFKIFFRSLLKQNNTIKTSFARPYEGE
jgi:multimeric flavodoxin WrbA